MHNIDRFMCLSRSQSTAKMMVTSSAGSPTVSKTITIVTKPACGIPAAPILAAVAVIEIAIIWPMLIVMPCVWAMKMAATASYKAVPSMLIVAPIGRTNREIRGSTPFFSSSKFMVTGNVAEEEAVPKAVVKALVILAMNLEVTSNTTL